MAAGLIQSWRVEPYLPEVWRYGGEPLQPATESLFEADSDAVVDLLGVRAYGESPSERAETAVSVCDCLLGLSGPEGTLEQRGKWLDARLAETTREKIKRWNRSFDAARRTLYAAVLEKDPEALKHGSGWRASTIEARRRFAKAARGVIVKRDIASIAFDFFHMHMNRAIGSGPMSPEPEVLHWLRRVYAAGVWKARTAAMN